MPFGQDSGELVQVIGTGRDQAVDASGDGGGAAGVGNLEDRLVTFDDRLIDNGLTKQSFVLFEADNEFLSVLGLEGRITNFTISLITRK